MDLILEDKRVRWAFKHADLAGASRMILLAPDEWAVDKVRVKNLQAGEESDMAVADL